MSVFKCLDCGTHIGIPTRKWKLRKRGHIKTMWCYRCKRRTDHQLR